MRLKISDERPSGHLPQSVKVRLVNKRGLHARASAKFVACAEDFDAEISVSSHREVGAETVIADSIMELLMLGAACGEEITISATGPDAPDALLALKALVADHFGEGE